MTEIKPATFADRETYVHFGREIDYNDLHSLYMKKNTESTAEMLIVNNNVEAKFDLTTVDIKELIKQLQYLHDELTEDKTGESSAIPIMPFGRM